MNKYQLKVIDVIISNYSKSVIRRKDCTDEFFGYLQLFSNKREPLKYIAHEKNVKCCAVNEKCNKRATHQNLKEMIPLCWHHSFYS